MGSVLPYQGSEASGVAEHHAGRASEPAAPRQVASDGEPFVERDGEDIAPLERLGETVDDGLVLALEGAEEAIPHDEDRAVVLVQVALVRAVVEATRDRLGEPARGSL